MPSSRVHGTDPVLKKQLVLDYHRQETNRGRKMVVDKVELMQVCSCQQRFVEVPHEELESAKN